MWFRLLAKVAYVNDGMHYKWHEMTFCYRWDYKSIVVLCIGVDASFQNHLYQNLGHMWSEIQGSQPGSLLVPLIEVLVMIYDQSVWSIRDVIRHAEMVCDICITGRAYETNTCCRIVRVRHVMQLISHCFMRQQDMPAIPRRLLA